MSIKLECAHAQLPRRIQLFAILRKVARQAPLSMGLSRQEYWSGCHLLLPGLFLTQGLNLASCVSDSLPTDPPGKTRLSRVRFFVTPSTAALHASLSFSVSQSLLKLMSIQSAMPSNHLILCCPLLLLLSILPSIRVFFNESALLIRWPKYWSFSFSINPSIEYSGLISFRIDWFDFLASDKVWPTGEGNGKSLQYSCLKNPMNSMKKQKNGILLSLKKEGDSDACYKEQES